MTLRPISLRRDQYHVMHWVFRCFLDAPMALGPDLRDQAGELWRNKGRILHANDLFGFLGAVAEAQDSHPLAKAMAKNALDFARNAPGDI